MRIGIISAMSNPTPSSIIIQSSSYTHDLVEALRPHAEVRKILPMRRLHVSVGNTDYCYLTFEGITAIYRASDDRLIATLAPPSLFGIAFMVTQHIDIYLKTSSSALVGKIPLPLAERIINEQNLWEPLAKHMMIVTEKLYIYNQQLTAPSVYNVVQAQLKELMSEDKKLRDNITAERYIRDKTALSRSRVMQVLADLKKGGYITMERGVLLEINNIPDKY